MTDGQVGTQQATAVTSTEPAKQPTAATNSDPAKISKVKSFFEHIGEWLKDHLGVAQSVEHTAATALAVFSPLLKQLVVLAAGQSIAAKVSNVVSTVQTNLANAIALLNGAEAGDPSHTLDGFLSGVQTNLGTLLTDVDIKNSAKASEITSLVNTAIGEIEAIQTATAGHSAPVVGATTTSA
jgi:hypothetical protein